MVLFRWYDENTSLVALEMMKKTWNFVAKKIADGVNKFLSFFCVILIWCVCMRFSKISLVTSHGAFSTRLDFTAGNTPCRKINQSTTSIHYVPSVLVFRTAQVENTRLKCSGDVSLGNECKKKIKYRHIQRSHYMIPISNTELAGTQRNTEKGTVNDMTTFGEMTATSYATDWI